MRNFDEKHYLESGKAVCAKRGEIERTAKALNDRGYKNIVVTAIGGTWARWYAVVHIMKQYTSVPIYLENSAELCLSKNKDYLGKDSIVLTASNSGNTKEIVAVTEMATSLGADVAAFVEPEKCPLAEKATHCISLPLNYGEDIYLAFFWLGLALLYFRGDFPDYPQWADQMSNLHPALLKVKEKFEPEAASIARKYAKRPYFIMTSSGVLKEISYWFCTCVLEEMQWIHARPICAADFFHGTLEVLDKDVPLMVVKGEDEFRPLDQRVEDFARKITDDLIIFDTKDYPLEGIDDKFRIMCTPYIIAAMLSDRLEVHFELNTGHSLNFRRYYRQFDY